MFVELVVDMVEINSFVIIKNKNLYVKDLRGVIDDNAQVWQQ